MKNNYTAIIIDDEIRSRSILRTMLGKYCSQVSVLAEAPGIEEAIELLDCRQPDIVFLDIELGHGSGFDLLGRLEEIRFETIFVTAFENFAIKAIKWSAQDYLLKPVDPAELIAAVTKTIHKINSNNHELQVSALEAGIRGSRIGLPSLEGLQFIDIAHIIRCEAKGSYTQFYLSGNNKLLVSKNLQAYEDLLKPYGFFRVHHSHLVSLNHIKEYIKGRGGSVVMADNGVISIATRKKEDFLKHILH